MKKHSTVILSLAFLATIASCGATGSQSVASQAVSSSAVATSSEVASSATETSSSSVAESSEVASSAPVSSSAAASSSASSSAASSAVIEVTKISTYLTLTTLPTAAVKVQGVVVSVAKTGMLIQDDTGKILIFNKSGTYDSTYAVGDFIQVTGTLGAYGTNNIPQFNAPTIEKLAKENAPAVDYTTVTSWANADYSAYVGKAVSDQVSIPKCLVTISNGYVNFVPNGLNAKGSLFVSSTISYTTASYYDLTGYMVYIANGFRYMIVTKATASVFEALTNIEISAGTASIEVGESLTFKSAYTPTDIDPRTKFTWTVTNVDGSSNVYATIDASTGVLTGVATGKVNVSATSGSIVSNELAVEIVPLTEPTLTMDFSSETTVSDSTNNYNNYTDKGTEAKVIFVKDSTPAEYAAKLTSINPITNVYIGNEGSSSFNGLKIGSSKASGNFTMIFADDTKFTKVAIYGCGWTSGTNTIKAGDADTQTLTNATAWPYKDSYLKKYVFNITSASTIAIATSGRILIGKIGFYK